MKTAFKSKLELVRYYANEENCKKLLAQQRWPNGIACPHCGNAGKIYTTNRGYKCGDKDCHKKFTVITGTIFENTKIPLNKWFEAIFVISAHKKGISSHQLAKDIGVSQKTAWFIEHRVREMLREKSPGLLGGIIECDETLIGGLEKNKHAHKRTPGTQGRSTKKKKAVAGILHRGGEVRVTPVPDVSKESLQSFIYANVKKNSVMFTDTWKGYNGLKADFRHLKVNHSQGEYVRGAVYTNGIENFWSHLSRGIIGIYHQVSTKHLHRYCYEFSYRYNTRKITDVERFNLVLSLCDGRLKWNDLIAKQD